MEEGVGVEDGPGDGGHCTRDTRKMVSSGRRKEEEARSSFVRRSWRSRGESVPAKHPAMRTSMAGSSRAHWFLVCLSEDGGFGKKGRKGGKVSSKRWVGQRTREVEGKTNDSTHSGIWRVEKRAVHVSRFDSWVRRGRGRWEEVERRRGRR